MPRSNTTGGKNHKKGKKNRGVQTTDAVYVDFAGQNQVYGLVKKRAGGSRIIVECSDEKERSGIIPGKMFKKVWINPGDILLCDLNVGGDDSQCYISEKYTPKAVSILRAKKEIKFDVDVDENEEEENIKFIDNIDSSNMDDGQNKENLIDAVNDDSSEEEFISYNPNKQKKIIKTCAKTQKNVIECKENENEIDNLTDSDDSADSINLGDL